MTRPRDEPARRCMPLQEWPEGDRAAWEVARSPASDVFSAAGAAAHWRPHTCRSVENGYGRWLTYLDRVGALGPETKAGNRVTVERLRSYIDELSEQISSTTLAGRIRDLNIALRIIDPDFDDQPLRLVRQKLKSRAKPIRNKRAAMIDPSQLLRLAAQLIERAEASPDMRQDWRACTYRDGLIILVLIFRPLRRHNLAALALGRTLFEDGDTFRIAIDGSNMKNGRDYGSRLPAILTPLLGHYIQELRPILLRGGVDDRLWISSRGNPLDDASLYGKIVQHTRNALGVALSPHLFRDIAVSYLGEENPELIWLASALLHHSDPRTTEAHYNHAVGRHAMHAYQRVISDCRQNRGANQ